MRRKKSVGFIYTDEFLGVTIGAATLRERISRPFMLLLVVAMTSAWLAAVIARGVTDPDIEIDVPAAVDTDLDAAAEQVAGAVLRYPLPAICLAATAVATALLALRGRYRVIDYALIVALVVPRVGVAETNPRFRTHT